MKSVESISDKNVKTKATDSKSLFRPDQSILDVFWTLSDGKTNKERNDGAVKLCQLIHNSKVKDEENHTKVVEYCKDRLIRGLGSGRTFARVGFSVALTQLLRSENGLKTSDILQTLRNKLKVAGEKKTKSEVGGIYLGKVFGFSSLTQSGRLAKATSEELLKVVEDLLTFAQRKSYLKPVCNSTLEDIVRQISVDAFGESVWPRIRDVMKEGWTGCTLDRLSLLLVCREKFPDVVNKKFLKKHWGFPVLGEENMEKLLPAILETSTQRSELLQKKIFPFLSKDLSSPASVWQRLGNPLVKQGKNPETTTQRQILGLELAGTLLNLTTDSKQVEELMLCPSLVQLIFHVITHKNDPLALEANTLFEKFQESIKSKNVNIESLLVKLWQLSADDEHPGLVDIINSLNFIRLIDLMEKDAAAKFAERLMGAVKGSDKSIELSSKEGERRKQVESCLRCVQHTVCSQRLTSLELQKSALALFLRLAYFSVKKKCPSIQHCESVFNLEDGKPEQVLCRTYFFKCLDQFSTMAGNSQKRSEHLEEYISLQLHLVHYLQSLLECDKVVPLQPWDTKFPEGWSLVYKTVIGIQQKNKGVQSDKDSAFLLLFLYLAFQLLTDLETAADLLQEVSVCHKKASKTEKGKKTEDDETDPAWQEVVTEVLLNMMSLQSHLGRIISCTVLRLLSSELTVTEVQLITEVLIPKSGKSDDAGGVLVEADDDEDEENEDSDLLDEDVPDEESEDDSNDEEEEEEKEDDDSEDEAEEEDMQVDEAFRTSVKEALGEAADGDDEEEDLSDLSDTEMFKLDDMLAEVFRQKKKIKDKKKMEVEKKKEMGTFRIKVLDMVEVLVKSDRCGDFVPELLRPLLLLMLKTDTQVNQEMSDKTKGLFKLLKTRSKGLTDSVHDADEQSDFLQELLDLAQTVTDSTHIQEVSTACHIMIKMNSTHSKEQSEKCQEMIRDVVRKVVTKEKSKPSPLFFTNLIDNDVARYQFLCPMLVSSLKDSSVKSYGKMICCCLLSSLLKKSQQTDNDDSSQWLQEVASLVSQSIKGLQAEDIKVMYTKELLSLAIVLQHRMEGTSEPPFGLEEAEHLSSIKSKFNTDLRKLTNKVISGIEKSKAKSNKTHKKKNKKKRKSEENCEEQNIDETNKKVKSVKENGGEAIIVGSNGVNKKKNKKRKISETEDATNLSGKKPKH